MSASIKELLGILANSDKVERKVGKVSFSLLFFSDVRKDISEGKKFEFMRDITLFADREGFTAVYIPERHFYEFGAIYANSAIIAAYLIPQTSRLRFRTAGISLPLHHPAEVVEWWAMNDILSGGRVDLGFGSGWNRPDFIISPSTYANRQTICSDRIPIVQKLWRGETICFPGPNGEDIPIKVYPRPIQSELNVWLLVFQNDEAFRYAGRQGYNIFTMLYGINLECMAKKISLYRQGRKEGGYDPDGGTVSLMLHTFLHKDMKMVQNAVERPFKEYIESSLNSHLRAGVDLQVRGSVEIGESDKVKILDYAYQRYFKTAAIFGTIEDGKNIVDQAIQIGVTDIACVVDFGVDYSTVRDSLPYLRKLISYYL